jgi:hypothetical protein
MFAGVKREGDSRDQPLASDGRQLNLLTPFDLVWTLEVAKYAISPSRMIANMHCHWQSYCLTWCCSLVWRRSNG